MPNEIIPILIIAIIFLIGLIIFLSLSQETKQGIKNKILNKISSIKQKSINKKEAKKQKKLIKNQQKQKEEKEQKSYSKEETKQTYEPKAEPKEEPKEEQKLIFQCPICKTKIEDYIICENCIKRSKVIKDELPKERINTYDNLKQYQNELMYTVLTTYKPFEKESSQLKLLAIAYILHEKYFVDNAANTIIDFLKKESNNLYSNEELIRIFNIEIPNSKKQGENHYKDSNLKEENNSYYQQQQQTYIYNETTEQEDKRSPFSKGCGTTVGIGCGIMIVIAILIMIATGGTGILLSTLFN